MQHLNGLFVKYAAPARYALFVSLYALLINRIRNIKDGLRFAYQNDLYFRNLLRRHNISDYSHPYPHFPPWFLTELKKRNNPPNAIQEPMDDGFLPNVDNPPSARWPFVPYPDADPDDLRMSDHSSSSVSAPQSYRWED